MTDAARGVQRVYLGLTLLTTLAASFIWGINTLFLLDAGLSNTEAFAANAFFTLGQVIFEVPTGVVADTRGRRFSFMLGAATLLVSTLLYLVMWNLHAPLWGWAIASILLGLGFTFFSGATEAWLVDALAATGFTGSLESVFGRAQVVGGGAMLIGSVAGGVIAQVTDLGVPYIVRAGMLGVTLVVAWWFMHDLGFTPERGASPIAAVRTVLSGAVDGGLRNRPVRWLMLAAHSRSVSASTRSTPSSRTCSSCTATRPPTASRAWPRRSSPARRSSAASRWPGYGGSSSAGPMPSSWAASLPSC